MKGGLNNLVKQAQMMQTRLQQMQEQLANQSAEGQSGGGMVKAVVNGKMQLLSIHIEKDAIDPNDPEMLQDLIVAAVNTAGKNMQDHIQEEMSKVTGGMRIPGLF